jgi:hypothetical protein
MEPCLQRLVSFFKKAENRKQTKYLYHHLTAIGQPFVASDLRLAANGLYKLKLSGLLDCTKLICDAGSADGRIVALATCCFGIPSIGVEYDPGLVNMARQNIDQLAAMGIIRNPVSILQGNFCRNTTYKRIRFKDIATFYCFESNSYCLAKKIIKESPKGTLFVYHSQNGTTHFEGLKKKMTLSFKNSLTKPYYIHALMN